MLCSTRSSKSQYCSSRSSSTFTTSASGTGRCVAASTTRIGTPSATCGKTSSPYDFASSAVDGGGARGFDAGVERHAPASATIDAMASRLSSRRVGIRALQRRTPSVLFIARRGRPLPAPRRSLGRQRPVRRDDGDEDARAVEELGRDQKQRFAPLEARRRVRVQAGDQGYLNGYGGAADQH